MEWNVADLERIRAMNKSRCFSDFNRRLTDRLAESLSHHRGKRRTVIMVLSEGYIPSRLDSYLSEDGILQNLTWNDTRSRIQVRILSPIYKVDGIKGSLKNIF